MVQLLQIHACVYVRPRPPRSCSCSARTSVVSADSGLLRQHRVHHTRRFVLGRRLPGIQELYFRQESVPPKPPYTLPFSIVFQCHTRRSGPLESDASHHRYFTTNASTSPLGFPSPGPRSGVGSKRISPAAWQALGKDRHSLFGIDPLFVDPLAMNFELKLSSPAVRTAPKAFPLTAFRCAGVLVLRSGLRVGR